MADDLAREAYEAYGDHVGWKNYLGKPMPTWFNLPMEIQDAWRAAVSAVKKRINCG